MQERGECRDVEIVGTTRHIKYYLSNDFIDLSTVAINVWRLAQVAKPGLEWVSSGFLIFKGIKGTMKIDEEEGKGKEGKEEKEEEKKKEWKKE